MSHWDDELRTVGVRSEPSALRAANLSPLQKMPGIQPGEQIEVYATYVQGGEVETNRRVITAPEQTGTTTATVSAGKFGEQTTTFNVVPRTDTRDIETNPDEVVDVSSQPGVQGAERVESGVSSLAQQTRPNAMTVGDGGNGLLMVALLVGAVALIGGALT